jgi:lipopolysaccharide export system permease protein
MVEKIPRFLRADGAGSDITLYFIYKIPEMFARTASFSVLMATLLTLGVLSRDSEIIAMRSCGISLLHISMPMTGLGLLVSLLLLINAELIVPQSYEKTEYIDRISIKKGKGRAFFKRNNIWFRSSSLILQAHLFDPQLSTLHGVTVWTLDESVTPVSRIDADSAVLRDGRWTLQRATIKDFISGRGYAERTVPTVDVPLALKIDDLRVLDSDADNMSYRKLRQYADNLRSGGYQAHRYLTMMHSKLAAPFSALVMVILGIPFALRNSRTGGVAMGIGASVGIGFAYFVINALLLSYGRSGVMSPVIAAWGANVLFLTGGVYFSMKRTK